MSVFQKKRVWFWIAIAAIIVILVFLIVPNINGNSSDQSLWLGILPVFFVSLIAPLDILPLFALLTLGHTPEAPEMAPSFQRPPPFAITLS